MEFQNKLLAISHKLFISGRKSYTPEEYHEIDEAIAATNELIKDIVNKDMITIKPSGGDDTSQMQKAIDTIDNAEYFRKKLLSAFGLTNKEEEKSDE